MRNDIMKQQEKSSAAGSHITKHSMAKNHITKNSAAENSATKGSITKNGAMKLLTAVILTITAVLLFTITITARQLDNDFHTNTWDRFSHNYQFSSGPDYRAALGRPTQTDITPHNPTQDNVRRNAGASFNPPPTGFFSGSFPTERNNVFANQCPIDNAWNTTNFADSNMMGMGFGSNSSAFTGNNSMSSNVGVFGGSSGTSNNAGTIGGSSHTASHGAFSGMGVNNHSGTGFCVDSNNSGQMLPSTSILDNAPANVSQSEQGGTAITITELPMPPTGANVTHQPHPDLDYVPLPLPHYGTSHTNQMLPHSNQNHANQTLPYTPFPQHNNHKPFTPPLFFEDGSMGRLTIPSINLWNAVIFHGVGYDVIDFHIGHFPTTSAWNGNVGLAAHNGGRAGFFARLNELQIGDEIIYATPFGTRFYEVIFTQTIHESDFGLLGWSHENTITLITCVRGWQTHRLAVVAVERIIESS